MKGKIEINFAGNRGSYPLGTSRRYDSEINAPMSNGFKTERITPFAMHGGDTFCAYLRWHRPDGGIRFIGIDNGTGVSYVSREITYWLDLLQPKGEVVIDWFQTHGHLDHFAFGIAQNDILFQSDRQIAIHFWNANLRPYSRDPYPEDETLVEHLFKDVFRPSSFPVSLADLDAFSTTRRVFHEFPMGETLDLGDGIKVLTCPMSHKDGCLGLGIEVPGHSRITIATDNDIGENPDPRYLELMAGPGPKYVDCQFLDEEYYGEASLPGRKKKLFLGRRPTADGWGHSCPRHVLNALKLCDGIEDAIVVFGHHHPTRMDPALEAMKLDIWKRAWDMGLNLKNTFTFGKDGCSYYTLAGTIPPVAVSS